MRKIIIDTDTGSDDAAAILLALSHSEAEILCLTTVAGNVPLEQGTKNALQTLEIAGADIPVYPGADRPLYRPLVTAQSVHGKDGLGDMDLCHPTNKPQNTHAVTAILNLVRQYPDEVEIISLGPATNLALALLTDRETMSHVKHIWSMGTAGFGMGNCTSVAEFNVYVDAEAYQILLTAGIPLTIAGFDICLGEAALHGKELSALAGGNRAMQFVEKCTRALVAHNQMHGRGEQADLPDAVAMAVALWPDVVETAVSVYAYCCTKEEASYGQVIFTDRTISMSVPLQIPPDNAVVIKTIDSALFKARFCAALQKLG